MTINSVAGRAFVSHGNCKLITRVMSPSAMREWPAFHFLVGRGQLLFFRFCDEQTMVLCALGFGRSQICPNKNKNKKNKRVFTNRSAISGSFIQMTKKKK